MSLALKQFATGLVAAAALASAGTALAQDTVRIGLIAEMSGPFSEFGDQMEAGIRIFQKQHGETVAGKRVQVVVKDVGGPNPEAAKRLAQELIVRDKVQVLAGFGFTPNALSVAPLATQAKVPMVVMNAAAAGLTDKSPYMTRVSFGYPDIVPPIAHWALQQGHRKAYVLVADYAPGHDAEAAFLKAYKAAGGEIVGSVRVPMMTVDFAAYMQRVKDARPDVLFAFVNAGNVAPAFMKEFREKGLPEAGIKLIGTGDIVMENSMEALGDRALGTVTSYPYSMQHPSDLNRSFIAAFKALRGAQANPTIMAVSAYDGMAAIYAALEKTGGKADGPTLLAALKGLRWESPRGPIGIDARTGDVVQDNYIRRVEKVGGVLVNTEFETVKAAHR